MDERAARALVRDGYDLLSDAYTSWAGGELSPGRMHALQLVNELVPAGARVLDLGCGAGIPMTSSLAERYAVHGVDVSARQIEAAHRNVPNATFQQADLVDLRLPPASIGAVVAFYSLIHVPREHHAALLARIRGWLTPGGTLIASFGTRDDPGTVDGDWLGAPMFFSHFDAEANLLLLQEAGFEIKSAQVVTDPEDDAPASFLWVGAVSRGGTGAR